MPNPHELERFSTYSHPEVVHDLLTRDVLTYDVKHFVSAHIKKMGQDFLQRIQSSKTLIQMLHQYEKSDFSNLQWKLADILKGERKWFDSKKVETILNELKQKLEQIIIDSKDFVPVIQLFLKGQFPSVSDAELDELIKTQLPQRKEEFSYIIAWIYTHPIEEWHLLKETELLYPFFESLKKKKPEVRKSTISERFKYSLASIICKFFPEHLQLVSVLENSLEESNHNELVPEWEKAKKLMPANSLSFSALINLFLDAHQIQSGIEALSLENGVSTHHLELETVSLLLEIRVLGEILRKQLNQWEDEKVTWSQLERDTIQRMADEALLKMKEPYREKKDLTIYYLINGIDKNEGDDGPMPWWADKTAVKFFLNEIFSLQSLYETDEELYKYWDRELSILINSLDTLQFNNPEVQVQWNSWYEEFKSRVEALKLRIADAASPDSINEKVKRLEQTIQRTGLNNMVDGEIIDFQIRDKS